MDNVKTIPMAKHLRKTTDVSFLNEKQDIVLSFFYFLLKYFSSSNFSRFRKGPNSNTFENILQKLY